MRTVLFMFITAVVFAAGAHADPPRSPRVLVTAPNVTDKAYRAVGDVIAGTVIRELEKEGGIELIGRERAAAWLRERKLPEWAVDNRDLAREMGTALGADIVIYSTLSPGYDVFAYSMGFLEVDRDIVQKVVNGSFSQSAAPREVGKTVGNDVRTLFKFIPRPEELGDRGIAVREVTVNPDSLPMSAEVPLPHMETYGNIEQVLSYYRVFPGESEYLKLAVDQQITRIQMDAGDLNDGLERVFSRMQMYGEFALRYNMQAYLVKNCSVRALAVLLANKVPVFWTGDEENIQVLSGYYALRPDGACIFRTNLGNDFDSMELAHRNLVSVLILLPKPGKQGGISRESLQRGIGTYHNDWGKTPELVEIKEGILDIISSGLEGD